MGNPRICEDEVVYQIRELWPEIEVDAARFLLWEYTCFPFTETDDPISFWLNQIREFLRDRPDLKEEVKGSQ